MSEQWQRPGRRTHSGAGGERVRQGVLSFAKAHRAQQMFISASGLSWNDPRIGGVLAEYDRAEPLLRGSPQAVLLYFHRYWLRNFVASSQHIPPAQERSFRFAAVLDVSSAIQCVSEGLRAADARALLRSNGFGVPLLFLLKGSLLQVMDKYGAAIQEFQAAIACGSPTVWKKIAIVSEGAGSLRQTVEAYFEKGVLLPVLQSYQYIGLCQKKLKQFDALLVSAEEGVGLVEAVTRRLAASDAELRLKIDDVWAALRLHRAKAFTNFERYAEAEIEATYVIGTGRHLYQAFFRRAVARQKQRSYEGAIEDLEKAVSLTPDFRQKIHLLKRMANAWLSVSCTVRKRGGSIREAVGCYESILQFDSKDPLSLAGLAECYSYLNDPGKCDFYRCQIPETLGKKYQTVEVHLKYVHFHAVDDTYLLSRVGLSHFWQKRYARALVEYDKAIEFSRLIGYPRPVIFACRGDCYQMLSQHEKAVAEYTAALQGDSDNVSEYWNRGMSYLQLDDYDKAVTDLLRGIEGAGRTGFDAPEGELERQAQLSSTILRMRVKVLEGFPIDLIMPFVRVLRILVDDCVLSCVKAAELAGASELSIHALLHSDLAKSLAQIISLGRGDEQSSRIATAAIPIPAGYVVAYHLVQDLPHCPDTIVRWVATDGVLHHHCDSIEVEGILRDKHLRSLADALRLFRADEDSDLWRSTSSEATRKGLKWALLRQQQASKLFGRLLWSDLEVHFRDPQKHLFIIPDRDLFRVPYAALLNQSGKFLIESRAFSVGSSIRMIKMNEFQAKRQHEATSFRLASGLVCALMSLPNAKVEARLVASEIGRSTACPAVTLMGENFSFHDLRSSLRLRPAILHIASHSSARPEKITADRTDEQLVRFPEYQVVGRLSLAGGELLHARDLPTEFPKLKSVSLVFLNSCESGEGNLKDEGVLGFYRAFFSAGVPSVICAMWRVKDKISLGIAKRFYESYLRKRLNKAQALREAILGVMKETRFPRFRDLPYLWAGFQLFGFPV